MALLFKNTFLLFYGPSKKFFENQIQPLLKIVLKPAPFFNEIERSSLIGWNSPIADWLKNHALNTNDENNFMTCSGE